MTHLLLSPAVPAHTPVETIALARSSPIGIVAKSTHQDNNDTY